LITINYSQRKDIWKKLAGERKQISPAN